MYTVALDVGTRLQTLLQQLNHIFFVRPAAADQLFPQTPGPTGHHIAINDDIKLTPATLLKVRIDTKTVLDSSGETRRPILVASAIAILDTHVHALILPCQLPGH